MRYFVLGMLSGLVLNKVAMLPVWGWRYWVIETWIAGAVIVCEGLNEQRARGARATENHP